MNRNVLLNRGRPLKPNIVFVTTHDTGRWFGFQHESDHPTEQLGFLESTDGPLESAPDVAAEFAEFMKAFPKDQPLYPAR